jgi:V/A-type H+-transporting ATPase subunit B
VVGEDALSDGERRYLGFADAFETEFVHQGKEELRPLEQTLTRGWNVASLLPRQELTMVSDDALSRYYQARPDGDQSPAR